MYCRGFFGRLWWIKFELKWKTWWFTYLLLILYIPLQALALGSRLKSTISHEFLRFYLLSYIFKWIPYTILGKFCLLLENNIFHSVCAVLLCSFALTKTWTKKQKPFTKMHQFWWFKFLPIVSPLPSFFHTTFFKPLLN